ncbi:hypothetical protein PVAND_004095 [Polypedilum vanderplanki]|uniref:AAA+ ATPase domain-containing protein n=1 Tax=Polypedilum vanderplanki TaxID=319348 RepID=A0A9J6BY21_POLVA|nr:hypothetical protein PVAND_004095 [Polypedilum vanderplanki]
MCTEIKIKTHLFVYITRNKRSSPQKLKIPSDLMKFPASNLVIIKSENNRKYICRLFYFDEVFDSKSISHVNDSVELNPKQNTCNEIKYIKEIESIPKLCIFKNVLVKLHLNSKKLNLDIIKTHEDLLKITKSALKYYAFSQDCMISMFDENYGISKIYICETNSNGFGIISRESLIVINEIEIERPYNDIHELGGMSEPKKLLSNVIERYYNFFKNHKEHNHSLQCHVLLYGPLGCGKTALIHLLASQYKCNLFEIKSDIFKPYPGETEEELEKIFARIKIITKLVPTNLSIILIENIEIFCPKFDLKLKEASHSSRIASLIYAHLDEISRGNKINDGGDCKEILIIGTSSKIESVNIALRRVNRMGIEILINMPNENQRYEIIKILAMRLLEHLRINDIDELSKFVAFNTTGFVGADIELLCQFVLRQHKLHTSEDIHHLFECGLRNINPSVMRDNFGTVMRFAMRLEDIGGIEEVKKSLLTCILGPLRNSNKFLRFGLRSPSGILLYGPSGCAKTTIVKCLAGESKMTLISVSSAEIYSPYVGEAEKFIVKLFNQARMSAPSILFFDEIDTIVGSRNQSNGSNDTHMRILSTLLTEIDGFGGDLKANSNKPVLIIGATNRPECIDDALMRPGRFDKLIHIPAPDYNYRLQILQFLLKSMPIANDFNAETIAKRTNFFSGADLKNLCNEAAMCAATRDINCDTITAEDFEKVLIFLRPSLDEKKIKFYENFEKKHVRNEVE